MAVLLHRPHACTANAIFFNAFLYKLGRHAHRVHHPFISWANRRYTETPFSFRVRTMDTTSAVTEGMSSVAAEMEDAEMGSRVIMSWAGRDSGAGLEEGYGLVRMV